MGSDLRGIICIVQPSVFQLTLPVWGATGGLAATLALVAISTHAPRVGSDMVRR